MFEGLQMRERSPVNLWEQDQAGKVQQKMTKSRARNVRLRPRKLHSVVQQMTPSATRETEVTGESMT